VITETLLIELLAGANALCNILERHLTVTLAVLDGSSIGTTFRVPLSLSCRTIGRFFVDV
jgi:hypothetical protein